MYNSEFIRIKKIERIFELLAYCSIMLDGVVAVSTFIFINDKFGSSSFLLLISDYLVFLEVILAVVLFVLLIVLKYHKNLLKRFELVMFKTKHKQVF